MLKSIPNSSFPRLMGREIVFDGFVQLSCEQLVNANGEPYSYYTLKTHSPAAVVLAETLEGHYVINQEYRHPTGQVLLGLPGGYLDEGEEACATAERELYEESGYRAERFTLIGSTYPYPGISDQQLYYIFAEGAYCAGSPCRERGELIHTVIMSKEELKKALQAGTPCDGNLCTALYLYNLMR